VEPVLAGGPARGVAAHPPGRALLLEDRAGARPGRRLRPGDRGPGPGKRVVLRLLADRLATLPDLTVGALAHPQSNLADFYRELGALFACALKPHNRWGGFQALREKWQAHLDATLLRPVLLANEAQEMSAAVLSELRLLTSTRFDSRLILSVVLAGDGRLLERLAQPDLLALGAGSARGSRCNRSAGRSSLHT